MKNFSLKHLFLAIAGIVMLMTTTMSCKPKAKEDPAINAANMDTTIKPGDNFYQYANGAWLKSHPIPNDYSRFGAFEVLGEENYKQLQTIMEEASKDKNAEAGSVRQKIRDFYNTGLDTLKIEKDGFTPIKADLAKIDELKTIDDVQKMLTEYHACGSYPLFYFFSSPDEKNSNMVIAQLYQGGLGLPDRDYYLGDDQRSKEIRAEYLKHVAKMFELIGESATQAGESAATVMQIETGLAKVSSTRLELRDPISNYNKMNLEGIKKIAPKFNWASYFNGIGLTKTEEINVGQPKFITGMADLLNTIPANQWKVYFRWNVVNEAAAYLSSDFEKQNFAFFGTVLSGKTAQKPRWKRVLTETSGSLGEAVGQLYVEKYFPPQAKERMISLVNNLKAALKERINGLTWMSDVTKKEAVAKLEKVSVKVGYPDKWIDYSSMQIGTNSYYENMVNATLFNVKRDMNKIGKPVDRKEWGMTPQTVNAYYSPNMNEIVFPAGILQPPFFFLNADDAVNYGAIGVVIGHEMSHGFDDQGRQYDKEGNLRDWWQVEDATNFGTQTKALVTHYDNFLLLDSLHVNGSLTLGENIADLGGVNISYTAFLKAMEGKDLNEKIDGFTSPQRFFLSYAQVWRNNIRDKELMRRLKEDVHSPGEARVNGIVYNVPAFYQAFDIKPTDKRYISEDKLIKIW
ncbi:MAG: M13 family metallopeptidase [Bacteroidales bacterium]